MNEMIDNLYKKALRDEKISLGVWLLFLIINICDIISDDRVVSKSNGVTVFTVLWFVLATRSFYKIKIIKLEYNISVSALGSKVIENYPPNKGDAPETRA